MSGKTKGSGRSGLFYFASISGECGPTQSTSNETNESTSSLVVGNPEKDWEIFFGEEAKCSVCHTFAGRGGKVAADLTVSVHRSPEALLRDIVEPSAAINPDYVSYVVQLESGLTLEGLLQSANEKQITLVDAAAKLHQFNRIEIEDIRANSVSLMPVGFDKLGKDKLQDLVAFLSTEDEEAKKSGLPTGVIQRDFWLDVPTGGLKSLMKFATFPDNPTGSGLLTRFESPVNWNENFGTRIRGYIHPPHRIF